MADQRFPRRFRLRKRRSFVRVQRGGHRIKTRHLVVCWTAMSGDDPRYGLTVSRKVGGAVVRNQVKRWLRESIRREPMKEVRADVVFIARPSAARSSFAQISEQVALVIARLGRMEGLNPTVPATEPS